jgi:rare lipoprotein A (RlpA)-like double-psi beta-barrel protein
LNRRSAGPRRHAQSGAAGPHSLDFERSRPDVIYISSVRRSRRGASASLSGPRPDRVAGWAVALGIFLILVATATSNGATGGASLPAQPTGGGAAPAGSAGPAGATTDPAQDPATATALARFQARLGLPPTGTASAAGRRALVRRMPVRKATWYGPGFYGRRTACGQRLRRSTLGVAHKTLPCGTAVTFYLLGRFVTVPVIDRGPYARGIHFDLTAAAASRLGLSATSRLRVIH